MISPTLEYTDDEMDKVIEGFIRQSQELPVWLTKDELESLTGKKDPVPHPGRLGFARAIDSARLQHVNGQLSSLKSELTVIKYFIGIGIILLLVTSFWR